MAQKRLRICCDFLQERKTKKDRAAALPLHISQIEGEALPVGQPILCQHSLQHLHCYDDGCVAFDMNYDHLAVAEVNQYRQLKTHFTVPFRMDGRTSNQIENALSEALEKVLKHAAAVKKPIAMEDIKDVKKELMYGNRTRNRKISQFAYDKLTQLAESKSQKYGIAIRKVNPAYTSQIGKLKYMRRMGLSIHIAAAYVIGRRAMGFKDKVPKEMRHLIPEAKRNKHHWSQWAGISSPLKTIRICKFYENINYKSYSTMTALKKALAV